ncbi:MAG: hypothetical protein ACQEUZ_04615 [Pseudomonadota bacterium]
MPENITIEDQAAETIRLGREVHRLSAELAPGGHGSRAGFCARAIARLEQRETFDRRDDAALSALLTDIRDDLEGEVAGHQKRRVEVGHDEHGAQYELQSVPLYTVRGTKLRELEELFLRFLMLRATVLDRAAAQRHVMRLMNDG